MIRPWYRSRLLWLGLCWQLLLVWAWWDAGAYRSVFSWGKANVAIWAGQDDGSIVLGGIRSTEFHVGHFLGCSESLELERRATTGNRERRFPAAYQWESEKTALGLNGSLKFESQRFHLAWWLVIAVSVWVWIGVLLWWQWRKAHLLKIAVEPLP